MPATSYPIASGPSCESERIENTNKEEQGLSGSFETLKVCLDVLRS